MLVAIPERLSWISLMYASERPATGLRPAEAGDKWRLFEWRNLPEVARWMYTDHEIGRDEHERWFDAALLNPSRSYWVIEIDGESAGLVNLYDIDRHNSRCNWAYYLADPRARGRGIGAFVEFLVLEHVFVEQRINKLWCEVLIDNEAVWKLHQSFGFQKEAHFRQHVLKLGRLTDVIGLGMLRDEWLARRAESCSRLVTKGHSATLLPLDGGSAEK